MRGPNSPEEKSIFGVMSSKIMSWGTPFALLAWLSMLDDYQRDRSKEIAATVPSHVETVPEITRTYPVPLVCDGMPSELLEKTKEVEERGDLEQDLAPYEGMEQHCATNQE